VTIVYARTSSYKSFFVMNIGWRLSRDGVPGLWFNTEMPHHETMTRLIQLEAGLNYRETRYRRELHANEALIRDAAAAVSQYPIWFNDRSALDISFIRGAVTRMKKQRNIKYVVVDLLDHVYSDKFRDNEVKNVAYVVQQMKEMAKREEVHVILTTHVRKPAWNAPQKPYIDLEEMKDSGAKYQDVDTAISLMVVKFDVDKGRYLPMSYEEIVEERQMARKHIVYVATTKNRNGDLGGTPFLVDLERGGLMRPEAE
jgi:replicative DNA helicase